MAELRLILLVAGALLIGGIWWWSRRSSPAARSAPRDLRAQPSAPRAEPKLDPHLEETVRADRLPPAVVAPSAASRAAWEPSTEPHTRSDDDAHHADDPATQDVSGFDPSRQMVLSLLVLPEHGERFLGADVLEVLAEADLRFGARRIFHRHDPVGATLWSVANMLEPGELDPARVQGDYVHGLVLFAVLPGPRMGSECFADMLATARRMATRLRGELADADRSTLTPQTIQHLRETVLEFERRHAGAGS